MKELSIEKQNAQHIEDQKFNNNCRERLEQSNSARIDQLIWIAALQDDESRLEDFADQLDIEDMQTMFPDFDESYEYDVLGFIQDYGKLGFLCRALFPICSNYRFDENGNATTWSSSPGHCRIAFFYAETPNGLIIQIEKHANILQCEFIETARKQQEANKIQNPATSNQ